MDCDIRIGTSGWYYEHWKERFYPAALPKTKWFEHYAGHFNTVEINNTFHHLPEPETLTRWRQLAPKGFLYTVKANRYITHIKRLKDTSKPLKRFFKAVKLLKQKLGPILYQLPPNLKIDLDLLKTFIEMLPKEPPAVFEFRDSSWCVDETFELLRKLRAGFCIHDMPGRKSPRIIVSDIIYIRFHGSTGKYSGRYSESQLQTWANWLQDHKHQARTAYAYFNNDAEANAVDNAKQLREQILG